MEWCPSLAPYTLGAKRFFKLSELAGVRWPNVTLDDIFTWHDTQFKLPVIKSEGASDSLSGALSAFSQEHGGIGFEESFFTYWVFFHEFRAIWPDEGSFLEERRHRHPELYPYNLLSNVYLALETRESIGFAHNRAGKINCTVFFDEQGKVHFPALFHKRSQKCTLGLVEIYREDLLLKASLVKLLEEMIPEITSTAFRAKNSGKIKAAARIDTDVSGADAEILPHPPGSKILTTWKDISNYAGCSVSTAQRRFKTVVRYTKTRRVLATTAAIDEHILKTAAKKKK